MTSAIRTRQRRSGALLRWALFILGLIGCSEPPSKYTSPGGGGDPNDFERACRARCVAVVPTPTCSGDVPEALTTCSKRCIVGYSEATKDECIPRLDALLLCQLELRCDPSFGICEPQEQALDTCLRSTSNRGYCLENCADFDLAGCVEDPGPCVARRACDSSCPTMDVEACVAEFRATGTCQTAQATTNCQELCSAQDLEECVVQWTSTGLCMFDDTYELCRRVCADVGATVDDCVEYWNANQACPDAPPACFEAESRCTSGSVVPFPETCTLPAPPEQVDGCTGGENLVGPASCTRTGSSIEYVLTKMNVHADCSRGFDLDGCDGSSCTEGGLAPAEGRDGVDNALAGLEPTLVPVGGSIRGVDEAIHEGLCEGTIELKLSIDVNAAEGCAVVEVHDGPTPIDTVFLNASSTGCLSGQLGVLPLELNEAPGLLHHTVVRMTVSSEGVSDGLLGAIADRDAVEAIANTAIVGGSSIAGQILDAKVAMDGNANGNCDALSVTFQIGAAATP